MKSSLRNMVLVLLAITLVSSAALGFIYGLTKGPIEDAKRDKTTGALAQVLPEFDNDPSQEKKEVELDGLPLTVYTAKKGGEVVGYAVETATNNGFGGLIKMMVGFEKDGTIHNVEVLEQNETPGLGSKMADPNNVLVVSVRGKNPRDMVMKVKNDGGEVDVITASTISSRAYADAVDRAYKAYLGATEGFTAQEESPGDPVEAVLPKYDLLPAEGVMRIALAEGDTLQVYTAYLQDKVVGYAVETNTGKAFEGRFDMMVGFDVQGVVTGIHVMKQKETPGYGAMIADKGNMLEQSFVGRMPSEMNMKFKEQGGDVDGISGATITSEAYIDAVERAWAAFGKIKEEGK